MKRVRVGLVLVLVLALASCASPTPSPSPVSDEPQLSPSLEASTGPFEEAACPEDAVRGIELPVTCGYLTVPEDRTATTTHEIRLLVVRVRPLDDTSADPMFALGFDIPWITNYPGVAPLATRTHREVIMPAMRGSGHADPSLVCTEIEDLADSRLPLGNDPADVVDLAPRTEFMDAVQECHDRLVDEGLNLAAYNLVEGAQDIEDLRAALGIDQVNLLTLGTFSRLAFEVMRRHPEHVRSVVLDSPSVPQVDMFTEAVGGTRASLSALAGRCRTDPRCDDAYPDVLSATAAGLGRVAATPLHITSAGREFLLGDVSVLRWLRTRLAGDRFPEVPSIVNRLADRAITDPVPEAGFDLELWPTLSQGYAEGAPWDVSPGSFTGDFSHGLFFSYACHDQLPSVDRDALTAATNEEPWYQRAYLDSPFADICERWDVGAGDRSVAEPVSSSIPTLLLTGEFDPFAPPALAQEAKRSLERAWVVELPGHSHNVLGYDQGCALMIRNGWVDAPEAEPDTTCLSSIPPVIFP